VGNPDESSDSEDEVRSDGNGEQAEANAKVFSAWSKTQFRYKRMKSKEKKEEELRQCAVAKRDFDVLLFELKSLEPKEPPVPFLVDASARAVIEADRQRKEALTQRREQNWQALKGWCDLRRQRTGEVLHEDAFCHHCGEREATRLVDDDWTAVCDSCFDSGDYAVVDYDPKDVLDEHTTHPLTRRGEAYCRRCCFPHHLERVLYTCDLDEWVFCLGCCKQKQLLRVFDHKNMAFLDSLERPIYKFDIQYQPKEEGDDEHKRREMYEQFKPTSTESDSTHEDSLDEQCELSDEDQAFYKHRAETAILGGDTDSEGEKKYKLQRREQRKAEKKRWRKLVATKGIVAARAEQAKNRDVFEPCLCDACTSGNMHRQPCIRYRRWLYLWDSDEDVVEEEREVVEELAADKVRSAFHKARYVSAKQQRRLEQAAHKVQSLLVKNRYLRMREKKARQQERERVRVDAYKRGYAQGILQGRADFENKLAEVYNALKAQIDAVKEEHKALVQKQSLDDEYVEVYNALKAQYEAAQERYRHWSNTTLTQASEFKSLPPHLQPLLETSQGGKKKKPV